MSETAEGTAALTDSGMDRRRRPIALWVILLAFGMDLLDRPSTDRHPLDPARPRHQLAAIQWIVAGYQLIFALFLITGGRPATSSATGRSSSSAWAASR